MGPRDKKSLEPVLAEFRTGIAHHRAEGATEQRIRQLLGEAIWLAFQQVKDRTFGLGSAMSSAKLLPRPQGQPVSTAIGHSG